MLECNKTVTLIHHEKGIDGDTYDCIVCNNASWFKKITISTSADGAKPVNTYECRILVEEGRIKTYNAVAYNDLVVLVPAQDKVNTYTLTKTDGEDATAYIDIEPAVGDYVALGVVESIEMPSDLKQYDYFRITAVGDNRRGRLSHWRLSGQ
jgi:hypothetical protein